MRGAIDRGHLTLALGDFNMIPLSLAHQLITTHAAVEDAWRVMHPNSSTSAYEDLTVKADAESPIVVPSIADNLTVNGTTCDSALNTWRWEKAQQKKLSAPGEKEVFVPDTAPDPRGKRLDYIFVGQERRDRDGDEDVDIARSTKKKIWRVEHVKVGFTNPHPVLRCSLSDHFSVEATLSLASPSPSQDDDDDQFQATAATSPTHSHYHHRHVQNPTNVTDTNDNQTTDTSITKTLYPTNKLRSQRERYLPISIYDEILSMITSYTHRETRQRSFRLGHFIVQCLITLACLIAVWWSSSGKGNENGKGNYIAFILMLIAVLGFAAGLLDGLIGGFFIGSELRALREFEWEIRNVRQLALDATDSSYEYPLALANGVMDGSFVGGGGDDGATAAASAGVGAGVAVRTGGYGGDDDGGGGSGGGSGGGGDDDDHQSTARTTTAGDMDATARTAATTTTTTKAGSMDGKVLAEAGR